MNKHSATQREAGEDDKRPTRDSKMLSLARCLARLADYGCYEYCTPGHRMGLLYSLFLADTQQPF
jgi:hypothetical protein